MESQRPYLNFNNTNADRFAATDRAYPTTPSTFPQPVFSPPNNQPQQQGAANGQANNIGLASSQPSQYQQQQQQQGGYFSQGQYNVPQYASSALPQQHQLQQHQLHQGNDYSAGGLSASNSANSLYAPRSNPPGASDPNTGLAHQFSHQNLGGARAAAAAAGTNYSRGPASAMQRPRTAGATGYQPAGGYNSYLNAPMPSQSLPPAFEFQSAPDRNPDRFGPNANNNQKKCSQLAADFFKDSVKRARERNQRCVEVTPAAK